MIRYICVFTYSTQFRCHYFSVSLIPAGLIFFSPSKIVYNRTSLKAGFMNSISDISVNYPYMPRINFKRVYWRRIIRSIVAYWTMICNVTSHRESTTIPSNPARVTCLKNITICSIADANPKLTGRLEVRGTTTGVKSRQNLSCLFLHQTQQIRNSIRQSRSRDSAVGIATGYGLDDRGVGVRSPVGVRIFSSPRRPDRFWGPPSLLSNGYRVLFPRG
jgi:hypothetical protein